MPASGGTRHARCNGRDPGIDAQRAKAERTLSAANDFETVARAWFELQKGRWTPIHARDVINSLEKEVFPWIGKLPVKEIDEPLLLSVLRKVERRGATETAHWVRQRIDQCFAKFSTWLLHEHQIGARPCCDATDMSQIGLLGQEQVESSLGGQRLVGPQTMPARSAERT